MLHSHKYLRISMVLIMNNNNYYFNLKLSKQMSCRMRELPKNKERIDDSVGAAVKWLVPRSRRGVSRVRLLYSTIFVSCFWSGFLCMHVIFVFVNADRYLLLYGALSIGIFYFVFTNLTKGLPTAFNKMYSVAPCAVHSVSPALARIVRGRQRSARTNNIIPTMPTAKPALHTYLLLFCVRHRSLISVRLLLLQ